MSSSLSTVISGLGVVAAASGMTGVATVAARRDRPFRPGLSVARDDTAIAPLARPLRAGCAGMDIAVWLDPVERLRVGVRGGNDDPGTAIGPLVLEPLARRVARLGGRVHPGQWTPMLLTVHCAEPDPVLAARAYEVLDAQLRRYPRMLTSIRDGVVSWRAVTVVLAGGGVPRHLLAAQAERYAFCDGNFGDVGAWGAPAALVPVVSEHWSWRFGWDGVEEMPAEERQLLREIVATAQVDGRLVRFFGIPEYRPRVREAYWAELFAAGVDLVTTARPRALARYLRGGGEALARHLPVVAARAAAAKPAVSRA